MEIKNLLQSFELLPENELELFNSYYQKNCKEVHEYLEISLEKLLNRGKILDNDYLLKLDEWLEKIPVNAPDRFKHEFLYSQILENFDYINQQILERINEKSFVKTEILKPVAHKPVTNRVKLSHSLETEKIKSYQFESKEWLEGINQNSVYKAIAKFNLNLERENDFDYIYSYHLKLSKMFDLSVLKAGCFISNYLLMFAKYVNQNTKHDENDRTPVSICTECNNIKPIDIRLTFKPVPTIKASICKDCILVIDTNNSPFDWNLWSSKSEFSFKKSKAETSYKKFGATFKLGKTK